MNSSPTIKLRFSLTFAETFGAILRMSVRTLRPLIAIVGLATVMFLASIILSNGDSSWRDEANSVGQWLYPYLEGAVPTLVVMIPVVALLRAWMIFRSPSLGGPRSYTFSDSSIQVDTTITKSEVCWSFYRRAVETRSAFLLYFSGGMANVIPKRAFADAKQLDDFRSL